MSKCGVYTLSEIVEKYCIKQFNDPRRGFDNYLVNAQDVWDEIRNDTLWQFTTVWLPVHAGNPHPYIIVPSNMGRFLGLYEEDNCGKLIPVLWEKNRSLIPKPKAKTCGCEANCNCGETCAEANSFTLIIKEHVINATTYTEKEWLETCKNGDVIRWREVPSLNEDDEVEVVTHQERVCKLETLPCGCVADSVANQKILANYCGCRFTYCSSKLFGEKNYGCSTTAQADDCGKIFLFGPAIKEWYAFQMQENRSSRNTPVPQYAEMAVMAGIDFHSCMFNPRRRNERHDAEDFYNRQITKIVERLNPIDFDYINRLQSEPRKLP